MINNIPLFKVRMNPQVEDYILPVLKSGMISQSKKVDQFEELLQEYFGTPYVLTLNSATSGLTLAYRLLNLNRYDDVISTPLTCFATNAAILANDLNIVWADTDPRTGCIDLVDVHKKLNSDVKALSFVHWGGTLVDLDAVNELKNYAKKYLGTDLHVIEDCAHAFGSKFGGKRLGNHGNICVFSLQAIKHLTCGDGGVIILPNKALYDRAKLLRWFGIDRERRSLPGSDFRLEPDIPEFGYKYHMNDINASIGIANFAGLDEDIQKCIDNGKLYTEILSSKSLSGIELMYVNPKSEPCYWIYTIKILNNRKQEFVEYMKSKNIVTSQVHARNDRHSCLAHFDDGSPLPHLDVIEQQIISIPVGWWVTSEDIENICEYIEEFSNMSYVEQLSFDDVLEYLSLLTQLTGHDYPTTNLDSKKELCKTTFVVKQNGKIVSTARLIINHSFGDPVGYIEDVVTDARNRGKGFSSLLINYITRVAFEKHKCYKIVLNCKDEVKKFYSKLGFTEGTSSLTLRN